MLGRILLVGTVFLALAGCAGETLEDSDGSSDAITKKVTVGRLMPITGNGVRLRRTPSTESTANIIGQIPAGVMVKIVDGVPDNGFYKVQVQDAKLKKKWGTDTGYVFGEYLEGNEEEKVDPDVSMTGTHDVPTEMGVKFKIVDCTGMTDDKGAAIPATATIENAIARKQVGVLLIDTNTFSYGMRAQIKEIDAKSTLNPDGTPIKFKIVKTAAAAPDGPFTVTMCGKPESQAVLAQSATDGFLNLAVYSYW